MKKTLVTAIAVAVVVCTLAGASSVLAAEKPGFSFLDGFGDMSKLNFSLPEFPELPEGLGADFGALRADMETHRGEMKAKMEAHRAEMGEKLAAVREKAADMSAYEQYGLVYDEAKGGWCYGEELVGLFIDEQGRGITFLSKNGETHIKAIRDESGNLTGIVELSADEYNAVIAEMDAMKADMQEHMKEMRQKMEERMNGMGKRMSESRPFMEKTSS